LRRVALSRTGQWIAGLNGAVIVSILIGALAQPQDQGYLGALYRQVADVPAFDFGTSSISGDPALEMVLEALINTAQAVLPAFVLANLIGIALGALLSWRRTDIFVLPIFHAARAVPLFCAALFALTLFAPAAETGEGADAATAPKLGIYIDAPIVWVVALALAGAIALALQSSARVALRESYTDNVSRFGLPRGEVIRAYALRHIFALALTKGGDIVLAASGAVVVAEWVFRWPGAGALFVRSVALQDWHVVALLVLILAGARFTAEFLGASAAKTLMGAKPAP
jgi:peptide/nickel transport system permease protein